MGTTLRELLPTLAALAADRRRERPLAAVADLVGLSPDHAQRTFRRLVGESPKHFQQRLRLETAALELAATDRPVIDVAFDHGFNSHESFTRAFARHFGRSPRAYRRTARTAGPRGPARSPSDGLVERTGPCVGLYRADLTHHRNASTTNRQSPNQTRRPPPMSYEIEVRTLTETPFIAMRRRMELTEVADQLAEMLPAVFAHVMGAGLTMAGPPTVRHLEQSPAFVTLEAGIPLAEIPDPPPADSGIEIGSLPGGPAAVTVHTGPYDGLGEAHAAVDRWLAAEGRTTGGAPWEVFLTDPGEVPDPADWQTEVVWPLAS